jgi:hypothetical protein
VLKEKNKQAERVVGLLHFHHPPFRSSSPSSRSPTSLTRDAPLFQEANLSLFHRVPPSPTILVEL